MPYTSTKAKTTTKVPGPFVVEMTFAQVKPTKITMFLFGRLWQRSEPAQRQALKVVLDQVADSSSVVDVDGSGRKAGVECLACQGFVAGKGQRATID